MATVSAPASARQYHDYLLNQVTTAAVAYQEFAETAVAVASVKELDEASERFKIVAFGPTVGWCSPIR